MHNLVNIIQIFGATGEEPEGIAALGIDPIAILAQAATFLLLFWIIKKFALDKIVATLENRRKTIDDGVRLGRKMEAEQEKLTETIAKELHKAREEADKIVQESRSEAAAIVHDAEQDARAKAEEIVKDAQSKIHEDADKVRKQLEGEIRLLVAEATEVILEEKINAKKDESLIERAIAKVRSA
ncbi:F0F1 ATP synthase subunit B [Candidatus Saccharibacteria bacterium]|nr:F0F1 ATP synthase subunit B [Candidatus Saccharibacteria bacterium]